MNADDEKKLQDEFFNCGGDVVRITNFAYALGRARGMTEAMQDGYALGFNASCEGWNGEYPYYQEDPTKDADWIARRDAEIVAAIEKARDA